MIRKVMTVFEHSFTLIGLVLGLALTEMLSGLVQALRSNGINSLGVLTPLLAIFVLADLTANWGVIWEMRSNLPSLWPVLGFGLLLSSMYYVAAALVFPKSWDDWLDLDAYYMKHRRLVLGLMLMCFVVYTGLWSLHIGSIWLEATSMSYLVLLTLTALAPAWKRVHILGLVGLIVVDLFAFFKPQ
jgi:hypothetical protein